MLMNVTAAIKEAMRALLGKEARRSGLQSKRVEWYVKWEQYLHGPIPQEVTIFDWLQQERPISKSPSLKVGVA